MDGRNAMSADLGIFPLHGTARRSPADQARHLHPAALPYWHALLGCRWQEHQAKVTALSRNCRDARRDAAEANGQDARQAALRRANAMWHQAVGEWRALGEIEAALARLAAGRFGWCENCGAAIAAATLTETPQARHCPACDQ
jgi:RNA polymerase-binding transcription factor DksA